MLIYEYDLQIQEAAYRKILVIASSHRKSTSVTTSISDLKSNCLKLP